MRLGQLAVLSGGGQAAHLLSEQAL